MSQVQTLIWLTTDHGFRMIQRGTVCKLVRHVREPDPLYDEFGPEGHPGWNEVRVPGIADPLTFRADLFAQVR